MTEFYEPVKERLMATQESIQNPIHIVQVFLLHLVSMI